MSKEVTIEADASNDGHGTLLLQKKNLVAYASWALTDAETRYTQIKKELIEIIFTCEKFYGNIYIYMRS